MTAVSSGLSTQFGADENNEIIGINCFLFFNKESYETLRKNLLK
jgi:hypothetical protein